MVKMFVLRCKRWTEFKNCVNWTIFSSLMSHDCMYVHELIYLGLLYPNTGLNYHAEHIHCKVLNHSHRLPFYFLYVHFTYLQ